MKRYIRYLLLATLTIHSNRVSAQQAIPLSLDDCIDYALKHNYAIKNSKLDVQIQDAQNKQVTASALPKISGKAELDDYLNLPATFFPAEFGSFIYPGQTFPPGSFVPVTLIPKYSSSATISGSQTLFDGSLLVALQARNTIMNLARQNGAVTEETVRYNVYRAYNALTIAYRQFDIIKNSLKFARSIEHDIIVTQQSGFAEKIEVERTSVQVNNLATDSIKINNILSVNEQVLKYQMGMDINTPIVLTDTNVESHRIEARELLEEDKEYSRVPEYGLLQMQQQLNLYNVRRYKLAALPTLSIFGNMGYSYSATSFSDIVNQQYIFSSLIGLQLNVPIFSGFLRTNQLKEARLNVEKTQNNIDNMKLTIDFQTEQSKTTLRNAILQVQSQRRNMDLADDVLDLAQKKYKAGVGSNIEVTQAQTDNLNAENNYFSALLDLINAEADLKKALGLLK